MSPVHFPRAPRRLSAQKLQELAKPSVSPLELITVVISAVALPGAIFLWFQKNAGHAYREAYLLTFGLQPDVLPWNTDDLSFLGYFTGEPGLVYVLLAFIALAVVSSFVSLGANLVSQRLLKRKPTPPTRLPGRPSTVVTGEVIFCWAAALILLVLLYLSVAPDVLLSIARDSGKRDAEHAMAAIKAWDVGYLKKGDFNFVEITREKVGTTSGVVVSCTEKFCGLYSPVGPVHTHLVPLTNIVTWSRLEWEDIPSAERTDAGRQDGKGSTKQRT
jgi:hypothetical protein